MRKIKLIFSFFCATWMVVLFQNCGAGSHSSVPATNPNSDAVTFLSKLASDYNALNDGSCSVSFIECSEDDLVCLRQNTEIYYSALSCLGYEVKESNSCIIAISNHILNQSGYIDYDATCFYSDTHETKSLYLDTCYAEYVGFDPNNPSTDVNISSWIDFGNHFPFSRITKTVDYHNVLDSIDILLAKEDPNSLDFTDPCNKTRKVSFLDLAFQITND